MLVPQVRGEQAATGDDLAAQVTNHVVHLGGKSRKSQLLAASAAATSNLGSGAFVRRFFIDVVACKKATPTIGDSPLVDT